jgi:hypothetical protein
MGLLSEGRASTGELRRGDVVEVRSAREILATLDETGMLEAVPFMPEMVGYCGRRFTVQARTEKLCDTINNTLQSRRLPDAVLLDDLRCDGSSHGGCQAVCRLYWKEAWLRRVDPAEPSPTPADTDAAATSELVELAERNASATGEDGALRYRCQATQMVAASVPLSTSDPRPYFRELTSGNVTLRKFARVMSRAAVMQSAWRLRWLPMPPLKGPSSKSPVTPPLDLRPGEWVRVKTADQIREMLTDKGANRGLWFDREMLAFAGKVFRVRARITRIIDERTGKMIELTSDCIALEDGVCSGEWSTGRWFCPREIYSYWRECWLERVDVAVAVAAR